MRITSFVSSDSKHIHNVINVVYKLMNNWVVFRNGCSGDSKIAHQWQVNSFGVGQINCFSNELNSKKINDFGSQ